MIALQPNSKKRPEHIDVRVRRQQGPGQEPYWELHRINYEPELNVISVLQRIAAQATTCDGVRVSPVAWDCGCLEEVCGACTMQINGRVRQSCSALVDKLLAENDDQIVLEPMSKFPVVRDLVVDRQRLFRGLQRDSRERLHNSFAQNEALIGLYQTLPINRPLPALRGTAASPGAQTSPA